MRRSDLLDRGNPGPGLTRLILSAGPDQAGLVQALVQRIVELERDNARLAEQCVRDPLTGLLNRRGLLEALADE